MSRPPSQLTEREADRPKRPLLPIWGVVALIAVAIAGIALVISK